LYLYHITLLGESNSVASVGIDGIVSLGSNRLTSHLRSCLNLPSHIYLVFANQETTSRYHEASFIMSLKFGELYCHWSINTSIRTFVLVESTGMFSRSRNTTVADTYIDTCLFRVKADVSLRTIIEAKDIVEYII